jgi:dolichyl-phosphate beta-glucosyltransferase
LQRVGQVLRSPRRAILQVLILKAKHPALISCVVPVFNEARCLEQNLVAIHRFLELHFGASFEIVCVDDCSKDASPDILAKLKPSLKLVLGRNPRNLGKGGALKHGISLTRGEHVFFTDADLSTPLTELMRFIPFLDHGYDVVIGNRKSPDARIKRYQPRYRVIMGLGYTKLVNFVMGLNVSDYTCGFKAFRGDAARNIFSRARIAGWSFDVEILYLAHRLGYTLKEVPVTWEDHPETKVRIVKDTLRSFTELVRIRLTRHDVSPVPRPIIPDSSQAGAESTSNLGK